MTLSEITEMIWQNTESFDFGAEQAWNSSTFQQVWFTAGRISRPMGAGWYWIETNADIKSLERPATLPDKGCDFTLTANNNIGIFPVEMRPKIGTNNLRIVYNGHEGNVMKRIRAHFNLINPGTGALGIGHYVSLSSNVWRCYCFTEANLNRIDDLNTRQVISRVLNNKTGRIAVETTWRTLYGWPELCKN